MADETAQLEVQVEPGADADARELDELTSNLRRQLLELDVERVERKETGPAPAGTRAVDVAALGALVVTLTQSRDVLEPLVSAVRSWLGSRGARSVKLSIGGDTLEVTSASAEEQRRLIDAWIARQARGERTDDDEAQRTDRRDE